MASQHKEPQRPKPTYKLQRNSDGTPVLSDGYYIFNNEDGSDYVMAEPGQVDFDQDGLDCENDQGLPIRLVFLGTQEVQDNLFQDDDSPVSEDHDGKFEETKNGDKDKTFWTTEQTKLLIDLYKTNRSQVGKTFKLKTIKKLWEFLQRELQEMGYEFTTQQIMNRWKTLEQGFKRKTSNNKQSGRARARCSYEQDLEEIFTKRANVFPELLLGPKSSTTKADLFIKHNVGLGDGQVEGTQETSPPKSMVASTSRLTPSTSVSTTSKPRTLSKQVEVWRSAWEKKMEEKEEIKEKRHNEKMELLQERNKLLQERNAEMKRKTDVIEAFLIHTYNYVPKK